MSIEKKVMITAVVNYGYPICRSLFVHAENTLEASEKADKYMKDECGYDLNGIQISCFGVYNDVKIL